MATPRPFSKPLLLIAALVLLTFGPWLYWRLHPVDYTALLASYPTIPALKPGDRITVVSPHLDDESLGLAGLLAAARAKGIPVSIIFMTNGDDNPIGADLQFKTGYATPAQLIASGVSRQQEALAALNHLGITPDQVIFFGLPDRGLANLQQSKYADNPYTAPGTLINHSVYSLTYQKDLPYTGNAARAALTQALNQIKPTLVFTTLPEDRHQDHQATARFVQQVLPQITTRPDLDYFLIHYRGYPRPGGIDVGQPLLPPSKLATQNWQVFFLSPDLLQKKTAAINEYKTQLRIPQLGRLMRSLIRKNELILPSK